MKLDVHVHHHYDEAVTGRLETILTQLEGLMSALDDLKAEVERNTSVEQSAVVLIQGLAQQLKDALEHDDTAALEDLTTKLAASADALAAAVAANTATPPTLATEPIP